MSGKRILVIDDDKDVLQFVAGFLRKAGYTVLTALDPLQGLMQAQREAPDLVLTDILMPAGGGFALLERLTQNTRTMAVPIIVLTGSTEPDLEVRAKAAGATRLLRKPCDNADLLLAVRESLGEG
ncbi:MAG TPA: response regulator [Candidatus Methylomirabilis sp.]